jgi:hypothetical protein
LRLSLPTRHVRPTWNIASRLTPAYMYIETERACRDIQEELLDLAGMMTSPTQSW